MMLIFLLSVAFASKCTYDSTRTSDDYMIEDNYHERYCEHVCPCSSENGECAMDFTYAEYRDLKNVQGTIDTLITRDYKYTFAVLVAEGQTFEVKETQSKAARINYRLAKDSTLIVGNQVKAENDTDATVTTIVRCNTKCTVKNSKFPKSIEEQISFMPEMNEDKTFIPSELTLENVEFEVQSTSGHFEKNYAREQLKVKMNNVKFNVEEDMANVEVIGLFYSVEPLELGKVELVFAKDTANVADYTITTQCDGKWLVALKNGSQAQVQCDDPTVSYGDEELEQDCETAFIVIASLFDIALFIIVAFFVVMLLIPVFKKKSTTQYQEIQN